MAHAPAVRRALGPRTVKDFPEGWGRAYLCGRFCGWGRFWDPDRHPRGRFVCCWWHNRWYHLSLGFHICLAKPNIEVHLPGGFIRIGWDRSHNYDGSLTPWWRRR